MQVSKIIGAHLLQDSQRNPDKTHILWQMREPFWIAPNKKIDQPHGKLFQDLPHSLYDLQFSISGLSFRWLNEMLAQSNISREERTTQRKLGRIEIQAFQLAVHNVLLDAANNFHFVDHGRLGSLLQHNSAKAPICSTFLRRSSSLRFSPSL